MQTIQWLRDLVAFPSVSHTSNAEVSRWIDVRLKQLGFETEWLEYIDDRGEQKVCVSGRKGPLTGRGFAYFCHSDVVPVESWSYPQSGPWDPVIADDRLYGRGACDMKGSLACMLAAAAEVPESELKEPLYFVCTADEEVGLKGAETLVAESAFYRDIVQRQCRAVVGEPTLLEVVHAHKGGQALRITAHGVAAHSSTGKGVNANMIMIPFLTDIRELCLQIEGDPKWQDARYEPSTINLNLGLNDHTAAINMTPAQSVCTIYFRTMPAIDADALTDTICGLAEKHGLQVETLFRTHPLFTAPDSPYVQQMLNLTGTSASRTVPYGTDGSCLHELEDVVVLGPGSIRQAHTDDEWISLEQLNRGTELYRRLIEHWCCSE